VKKQDYCFQSFIERDPPVCNIFGKSFSNHEQSGSWCKTSPRGAKLSTGFWGGGKKTCHVKRFPGLGPFIQEGASINHCDTQTSSGARGLFGPIKLIKRPAAEFVTSITSQHMRDHSYCKIPQKGGSLNALNCYRLFYKVVEHGTFNNKATWFCT